MNTQSKMITYFENVFAASRPHHIPINEAFEIIRTSEPVRKRIDHLRTLTEEEYKISKKDLPCYIFSGKFSARNNSACEVYEGIITIDLDNLPEQGLDLKTVKDQLIKDPFTYACFISPGGKGLKVLVKLLPDQSKHLAGYYGLERYYKEQFNLVIDEKCKDISRLCFISYDPDIYVNEDSKIFEDIQEESGLNHSEIIELIKAETVKPEEDKIFEELLEKSRIVKELACKPIIKNSPLISLNEEPYIFKNTIVVIQSKEGSHKSRFTNVLITTMIKKFNAVYDCLGFTLNPKYCDPPPIIVVFDTEQDMREAVPERLQVIKFAAGYSFEETPENLVIFPLVEYQQDQILRNIQIIADRFRKENPDRHLIFVIDIITDLTRNINDPEKCSELVNELSILANKKDCTIITPIHINPVGKGTIETKARGHLGTELKNKAALVIEITRQKTKGETEDNPRPIYKISTRKNRKGKIHSSLRVMFDEDTKLLRPATAEEISNTIDTKTNLDFMRLLFNKFRFESFTVKTAGTIDPGLSEIFGEISEQHIKRKLKEVSEMGFTLIEGHQYKVKLEIEKEKGRNKYKFIQEEDKPDEIPF